MQLQCQAGPAVLCRPCLWESPQYSYILDDVSGGSVNLLVYSHWIDYAEEDEVDELFAFGCHGLHLQ